MAVKTFYELIEWTRELHGNLAQCLSHCASRHDDEGASFLLGYLASQQTEIETLPTGAFKWHYAYEQSSTLSRS